MAGKRTREEKYPDTKYFHYYNANSHNHKTGDCVIRALCTATEISWEDCLTELFNIAVKKGYEPSDDKPVSVFLENHGFIKCKEPRYADNTKMTVEHWLEHVRPSKHNKVVATVGSHHIVAIMNGVVNDIWNSSRQTMHSYWVKEER